MKASAIALQIITFMVFDAVKGKQMDRRHSSVNHLNLSILFCGSSHSINPTKIWAINIIKPGAYLVKNTFTKSAMGVLQLCYIIQFVMGWSPCSLDFKQRPKKTPGLQQFNLVN